MNLREVFEKAAELDTEKVVIIDRWKGGVGRIKLFKIGKEGISQVSPRIYVHESNSKENSK